MVQEQYEFNFDVDNDLCNTMEDLKDTIMMLNGVMKESVRYLDNDMKAVVMQSLKMCLDMAESVSRAIVKYKNIKIREDNDDTQ